MAALGPYEASPSVAVAVSGGSDSMALALLMDRWCRDRGGRVIAITVDHGLRPESATEAAQVGDWLAARSIEHHVLTWRGVKPKTGIQKAARSARYRLILDWAREHGVLHVALAHQLEDQAETFLMRLSRGSGLDGLASMPAVTFLPAARLLRPLLCLPRARLRATLQSAHQTWIEDPSNEDIRYGRVRTRKLLGILPSEGVTASGLAQTANALAALRERLESATDDALARTLSVHPAGHAEIARRDIHKMPLELRRRMIARLSAALGGAAYAPRQEKAERLAILLADPHWRGGTLGGCQYKVKGDLIAVYPDPRRFRRGKGAAKGPVGGHLSKKHKKRDRTSADGVISAPEWCPERPLSETKRYCLSSLAGTLP